MITQLGLTSEALPFPSDVQERLHLLSEALVGHKFGSTISLLEIDPAGEWGALEKAFLEWWNGTACI